MPVIEVPTVQNIRQDLRVTKGFSKTFNFSTGGKDLTDTTVMFRVQRRLDALDIVLEKSGIVDIPPSNGDVSVTITDADLATVQSGVYLYVLYGIQGTTRTDFISGQFTVEPFDAAFIGQLEPIMRLALTTSIERLSVETRDRLGILGNPAELSVDFLDFNDTTVLSLSLGNPQLRNPEAGIFYFDFQSNRVGDFLAVWRYRFEGEEPQTIVKNVRWVSPAMFRLMPEIRLYIDKARKASNRTIAFNPVDIAVYIENSLRDFNATPPTTNLSLEALEGVLVSYKETIVIGAVIQACIAQGLLAVDQDFVYNDNGISLSIDHSAKLHTWYTALLDQYTKKKMLYKKNFFAPTAYVRTVVGQAFSLGAAKVPPSTLSRFRGWI